MPTLRHATAAPAAPSPRPVFPPQGALPLVSVFDEAFVRASGQTEAERLSAVQQCGRPHSSFWDSELRAARKRLRAARKVDPRSRERKEARQEFRIVYQRRLAARKGRQALWWSTALQRDSRRAWREIREGALLSGEDVRDRVAEVIQGDLTVSGGWGGEDGDVKQVVAPEVVLLKQDAAEEVGRYVGRLGAQDWSSQLSPFDQGFHTLFTVFWEWRGLVQERKVADPAWVLAEDRRGNPIPRLCQSPIENAEWHLAIDAAKKHKASARDGVRNEHLLGLDDLNREGLGRAFGEVVQCGEPESWKERAVTFFRQIYHSRLSTLEAEAGGLFAQLFCQDLPPCGGSAVSADPPRRSKGHAGHKASSWLCAQCFDSDPESRGKAREGAANVLCVCRSL